MSRWRKRRTPMNNDSKNKDPLSDPIREEDVVAETVSPKSEAEIRQVELDKAYAAQEASDRARQAELDKAYADQSAYHERRLAELAEAEAQQNEG